MGTHIISGCELHLYCSVCGAFADFSDRTKSRGIRQARKQGWSVDVTHDSVRCPEHKGQRIETEQAEQ